MKRKISFKIGKFTVTTQWENDVMSYFVSKKSKISEFGSVVRLNENVKEKHIALGLLCCLEYLTEKTYD